ncbi:MAG: hypothetical protein ABF297_17885 [Thiogranum sp.]
MIGPQNHTAPCKIDKFEPHWLRGREEAIRMSSRFALLGSNL